MGDWDSADPTHALDNAWAALDRERAKLAELGRHFDEASTTVRAKDHSLEMTFDGRGELVDLVFNTSKYRQLAPAQLAAVVVETVREGRTKAQQQLSDLMGLGEIPGLDLEGLATGTVRPDEVLGALLAPMNDMLADFGIDADRPEAAKNGKAGER
jgi:hypothetical protein